MSPWLDAFLVCIPPFALAAYRALSGRSTQRLVAAELAAGIGTLMLVLASFAWPHDRLHCVTFVNITSGALILGAAGLWGGSADDVVKVATLLGTLLIGGAAIAHATARAILQRRASG